MKQKEEGGFDVHVLWLGGSLVSVWEMGDAPQATQAPAAPEKAAPPRSNERPRLKRKHRRP